MGRSKMHRRTWATLRSVMHCLLRQSFTAVLATKKRLCRATRLPLRKRSEPGASWTTYLQSSELHSSLMTRSLRRRALTGPKQNSARAATGRGATNSRSTRESFDDLQRLEGSCNSFSQCHAHVHCHRAGGLQGLCLLHSYSHNGGNG